jgi:DNA-binding MarR family transcriptional regulator
MDVNRDELSEALNLAMRETSGLGVLHSQMIAEQLGVNSTDLECLDIIVMRGPVTAGELARATGLTTGAITGVIDRLERSGFAMRETDPADRRKVLVRALPAIEQSIGPLFEPMAKAAAAALAGYDDKELALLLSFLTRMNEAAASAMTVLRTEIEMSKAAQARRVKPVRA